MTNHAEIRPATPIACGIRDARVEDDPPLPYGEVLVCVDAAGRQDLVAGTEYRLLWSDCGGKALDVETLDGRTTVWGLRSSRFTFNGRKLP